MYDAIIVGARVAGAATALLLAREGYDVLVLDRDPLPSDKVQSTHLIHPPGVRRLREWGLLPEVMNSGCPEIHEYGLSVGAMNLMAPLPPDGDVRTAIAPRRRVLDTALLRGALDAGAQVREQTPVTGIVEENGRVVGVTMRAGKQTVSERARIVIGADGVNSRVGTWVGAQKYLERPRRLTSIWTYWSGLNVHQVPTWRDADNYAFAWPTDDGAVLVGTTWRSENFARMDTHDKSAPYFTVLERLAPDLREQMRESQQTESWRTGSVPNYFRESYGRGWALVGDAGYCRDPATAAGITDALRSADQLAGALQRSWSGGVDEILSLAEYEYRRNQAQRPFYEYTTDFARLAPYPSDVEEIMAMAADNPKYAEALTGMFAQTTDPRELFSPSVMGKILRSGKHLKDFRVKSLQVATSPGVSRIPGSANIANAMLESRLGEFGEYLRHSRKGKMSWRSLNGWQEGPILEEKL